MANLLVKDGSNSDKYVKKSGAGTDLDPFVDPDNGQASTTVAIDGDLRNIDTPAERLSLDPEANSSGAASAAYSRNFLLRWMTGLLQDVVGRLPGAITTYTHSTYSSTTTSGTALASNSSRRYALIINTGTVVAYIRLASSTATTSDIPLNPAGVSGSTGGSYEISTANGNLYTGAITSRTGSGTATLSIVEGV